MITFEWVSSSGGTFTKYLINLIFKDSLRSVLYTLNNTLIDEVLSLQYLEIIKVIQKVGFFFNSHKALSLTIFLHSL